MAYTLERLAKAFKAFVKPRKSDFDVESLAAFIGTGPFYHLRHRDKKCLSSLGSSWIDDDDTENYSPKENSTRPKRKSNSDCANQQASRGSKRARSLSPNSLNALQRKLEENLKREEEEKAAYLASGPFEYHFRDRNKPSETSEKDLGNAEMEDKTEDCVQHAHGAASVPKRCVACQELQMECSLVEQPFYYPCATCRADKVECILVPPPTWKRPCERCKSRRKATLCSYSSGDYDHTQPCQWCKQHGFECVAGPAKQRPPTGRHHTGMTDELRCAQADGASSTGMTAGKSSPSSPVEVGKSDPKPKHGVASNKPMLEDKISAILACGLHPPAVPAVASQPAPSTIGISRPHCFRAEYPHPLTILHEPSVDESEPCHWCQNFAYGITGLGVRAPKVGDFGHGRLIELGDGHTSEGKEPSRMCVSCVSTRRAIMQCPHREIMGFPGPSLSAYDASTAFDCLARAAMAPDKTSEHARQDFSVPDDPWCSLCREPAFHYCSTPQPASTDQGTLDSDISDGLGCGLLLCDYCVHVTRVYRGDLDAVVKRGQDDPNNRTGYRADVA